MFYIYNMKIGDLKYYYNNRPVEFILRRKLNENNEYIPRFTLKNVPEIKNVPVNKPVKPTMDLIKTAIRYGLIFNITYKGEKDTSLRGHSRVIYPLTLGLSTADNIVIRGYHLTGWSISSEGVVEKEWRLFRLDRILSITFTGSFFRLPPAGYNSNDKSMEKIYMSADFSEIRRNQQKLIQNDEIEPKEKSTIGSNNESFSKIKVEDTETILDLDNIDDNAYIQQVQDISGARITFLKSLYGSDYMVIIGAAGKPGNVARIVDEKNNNIGTYKVLDTIDGETLKRVKKVKSPNKVYKLYVFKEKLA